MKRTLALSILLISTSVLVLEVSSASPIETPPWSWRKGSFGISSNTEYFSTRANYDTSRGQFTNLSGDNSFTDFNTWVRGRYAFWPKFSMYGGFGLSQVRAVDAAFEKTNNALTEAYLGGHFTVWRKWLLMVAEVEASIPLSAGGPLKTFDRLQTVPLVDDGVYYGRALLHMRRDIGFFRLFGHVGVRVPTSGLAKTLLYGAYGEFPLGDYLMLGGGIDGEETLLRDELTLSDRSATFSSANAGSMRFRAYDPAILRGRGWVGFKTGQTVEIRAGYMQTLTGQRSAAGNALTLNVVFSSIPRSQARSRFAPGPADRISAPGNTGAFKLESEKLDPDVIKPQNDFEPQRSDDLNETERLFE